MTAKFYIIPTPIGGDFTLRAVRVLRELKIMFCEDKKLTEEMLLRLNIRDKKVLIPIEHREKRVLGIVDRLVNKGSSFGLVSSSGIPAFIDPGFVLIDYILKQKDKVKIVDLGGPSALTQAIMVSGIDLRFFIFLGNYSCKNYFRLSGQDKFIKEYVYPMIYFPAKVLVEESLVEISKICPNKLYFILAVDLNRDNSDVFRGDIKSSLAYIKKNESKEYVVIVIKKDCYLKYNAKFNSLDRIIR